MANLFGRNKLKEHASRIPTDEVLSLIEIVKSWHDDFHNGTLKTDKETSREQSYNQDFFIKILGYKEKPANPFSFEPKATTAKGQLPDAVISYNNENIAAVVELKGTNIPLDRPQQREGNMSPVQQAFKYKTQYRRCPFVIVSNFHEFRLYQDNQLDYERWTLDDLINPIDDYLSFKSWYILLQAANFIAQEGKSKTEQLLSDVRIDQEQISKKFYAIYKEARHELLRDLWRRNPKVKQDIDFGIEKAQKIIDRIVFVCFAQNKGLLPDDILYLVKKAASVSVYGGSLWNILKDFFEAIDRGSVKLEIPEGYNGGLFKMDNDLNNLDISDQVLQSVIDFGRFDFKEGLSVTILGHIFEQSISDLEEIKSKVNINQGLDNLITSRRKKDGIFYTPDYIVHYIVDNSLGAYLREHEERFKQEFGLKGDIQEANYAKREKQAYGKYMDFLRNIKVVDPACGSGAFLVCIFDYLLDENMRVADILGNPLFTTDDYVRDILQNNIFGVDLNEESVEITKLSIWLKTAKKGKKLTALDKNIRCGNSLIDDPEISGKKAFDWQNEFKDVFDNGGFDVIVMNPPYVRSRDDSFANEKAFYYKKYEYIFEKPNLYLLFIEQSINLLNEHGYLGFIVPNSILGMMSALKVRQAILENNSLRNVINLQGESFKGVDVETAIIILSKKKNINDLIKYQNLLQPEISELDYQIVEPKVWKNARNYIFDIVSNNCELSLIEKLSNMPTRIGNNYNVRVGLQAYEKGKGTPAQSSQDVKDHVFDYDYKYDESTFPYLEGKSVGRYLLQKPSYWLRWGKWLSQPKTLEQFSGKRIVIREITGSLPYVIYASLATERLLNNKSILNISPINDNQSILPLLAILNSKLISFYHQRRSAKGNRSLFPKIVANDLNYFPIPIDLDQNDHLANLAQSISDIHQQINSNTNNFEKLITSEFVEIKLSNDWWNLDFLSFISSLKLKLSLIQKDDILSLWNKYQPILNELSVQAKTLDKQIDQMVYELYDLTEDEIRIVEGE
jgi:tRNA1(Val) A37 N6-methylase TrmN6